jgi:multidrug resistance efflux pump
MAAEETKPQAPEHPAKAEEAKTVVSQPRKRRRWLLPVIVLLIVMALVLGIPKVLHALNTVSTDDAYVNS